MIGRSDQNGPQGGGVNKEVAFTLNATDHHAVYAASTGNFSGAFYETTPTLLARDHKDPSIVSSGYAVRRLTPQECARLQGFPDSWTDIPGASDSVRYKALGNSVAIPCVEFIMSRIAAALL